MEINSYLQSLESRIAMLEDHMGTVNFQLSELSENAQRNGDSYADRHVNSDLGAPTSESLPDLANIEDSVDAMGAVVFADEEDYGFFGKAVLLCRFSPFYLATSFKNRSFHKLTANLRSFIEYFFYTTFVIKWHIRSSKKARSDYHKARRV